MLGARDQLRNTEQNMLLTGVTAHMEVLRDTTLLELPRNNVLVRKEQLRETRDRFTVGEVTRTDVAQAARSSFPPMNLADKAVIAAAPSAWGQSLRNPWRALPFGFSVRSRGFNRRSPWPGFGPPPAG